METRQAEESPAPKRQTVLPAACAADPAPDPTPAKILVVTRGDYMTLQVLRGILGSEYYALRVVLVGGDDRTRKGVSMLRALWRASEWHYFCYEFSQFALFEVAGRLSPGVALNVASFSRARSLPVLHTADANSLEVLNFAKQFEPDLLLCVKSPQRIKPPLLAVAKHGNLNIHASRLPLYAGRAAHFWAMAQGETSVGSTAHYMTERFDAGPVLAQRSLPVRPGASAFEVLRALSRAGGELAQAGVELALQGAPGVPQDARKRTYYSHPTSAAYRAFRARGYRLLRFSDWRGAIREARRDLD